MVYENGFIFTFIFIFFVPHCLLTVVVVRTGLTSGGFSGCIGDWAPLRGKVWNLVIGSRSPADTPNTAISHKSWSFWGGRGSAMTNTVRQTPGGLLILHLDNVVVVVVVWCGGFMCV